MVRSGYYSLSSQYEIRHFCVVHSIVHRSAVSSQSAALPHPRCTLCE